MTHERGGQSEVLRQYLLGSTPDTERDRLERAILADDALYEELLATEEELIDEYVWGRLSESERASFRQYLSSLPNHGQKLEFANALRTRLLATAPEAEASVQAHRLVHSERSFARVPSFLWAAAILLVLVGGIWSWDTISGLREEVGSAEAEIVRLRENQDSLQDRTAEGPVSRPSAPLGARSFLLAPGTLRSAGSRRVIPISSEPELLEFRLDLGSNDYDSYSAVVHDANSVQLASVSHLRAEVAEERILVVFHASSDWFVSGDYFVSLLGELANEEPAPVERYDFRISLE